MKKTAWFTQERMTTIRRSAGTAGLAAAERAFLDAYLDGVDEKRVHWQLIRLGDGFRCGCVYHPDAGCPRAALVGAHEPSADIAGKLAVAAVARPV